MSNLISEKALKAYLAMKKPGYAILIDAPWGAGKTFFVRNACSVDTAPQRVRYVSLNGVSDEVAFRRALLKGSFEASLTEKGEIFGNLLSRNLKLGDLGSLARDFLEERLIDNLPETLIFDDIERATLDTEVLLALVNDFVEHKGKRAVLLVNSEEHKDLENFLARKEKLVGRTIKIEADFDAAFPSFISTMDNGVGKKFLIEHVDITRSVFDEAGHQNLRLLRNSLRDCCLVLDRIDEQLFEAKEPMNRFVRTYIALSMALAKNEISFSDFAQRDNLKMAAPNAVEGSLEGLNRLFNRHDGADINAHSGAVLSKALGVLLFVGGYADTESLNRLLRSTKQFEPQGENPLWRRVVHWGDLSWEELSNLVAEGKKYLFETSPIEAGPYLQIADGLLRIEEYGGLETSRVELKTRILVRITNLMESGGLPGAELGLSRGWGARGRHFSYGGYGCDANDDFFEIMEAMSEAQLSIYERQKGSEANALANIFQNDPLKFLHKISYSQDELTYFRVAIFQEIDVSSFAATSIVYLADGKINLLGQVFEKLADRHTSKKYWLEEVEWFHLLRKELEKRAAEHSKLARAQLELFFKYHWKFENPDIHNDDDV